MSEFQQVQEQFMAHIRDPKNHKGIDNIEDRRLKIYRELFFNNVNGFVASGFPVLRSLYDDNQWNALVRDFFINHDCLSPYFIDISREFLKWLTDEREQQPEDLPFLVELAHYEWVELDISVRKETQQYAFLVGEDLQQSALVLSQTAWPLSYSFPVHQISETYKPQEGVPGSVHIIVYRDDEDEVQFMQINGVTGMLLQLLGDNPGAQFMPLVEALAELLPQFSLEQLTQGALEVAQMLAERGILRQHPDIN